MSSMAPYLAIVAREDARAADDVNRLYAKQDAVPLAPKPRRRRLVIGIGRLRRLIGLSTA